MVLRKKLKKIVPLRNLYYIVKSYRYPLWKRNKYNHEMKSLKNVYSGKRCFIIGNGPSLRITDLELLCDEYTFAFNSIYKLFEQTKWRPTFYCAQDDLIIRSIFNNENILNILDCQYLFLRRDLHRYVDLKILKKNQVYFMPVCEKVRKDGLCDFSQDASKIIYDGTSVSYSALQLAYYMGFNQVYLIGMDHSFPVSIDENDNYTYNLNVKNHFEGGDFSFSIHPARVDRLTAAYISAEMFTKNTSCTIYNATRGGKLEVFKRVDFESIL